MKTLQDIQTLLAQAVEQVDMPHEPRGLYDPVRYILALGGKRIRPALALMACNLFADDVAPALAPAIGLEIFHNFTLLHDDIMDRADVRRGQPTVHRKWNDNTAILSGDAMQTLAFRYLCRTPGHALARALDAFTQMSLEICEGQQYDMEFETRDDVTPEEYIEMIRLKTAVLLGTALRIGAWVGGASDDDAARLYDFGINIGLAFQLKDDLLDVYGDERTFGKRIGGDISCNKKTYLLIQARLLARDDDARELDCWLATRVPSQQKIDAVTALYNRLGVRRLCEERMDDYYRMALASLDRVNVDDAKKQELRNLARKLMQRNE